MAHLEIKLLRDSLTDAAECDSPSFTLLIDALKIFSFKIPIGVSINLSDVTRLTVLSCISIF